MHDLEIETWRGESGAAYHDQMRDRATLIRDIQCVNCLQREGQRLALEPGHAVACRREIAAAIEPLAIEELIARFWPRFKERVPMLNIRHAHHAIEQRGRMRVR